MEIQISSGAGPRECEMGVFNLLESLLAEFPGARTVSTVPGEKKGLLRSALISSSEDLSFLEGTVLWICKSPLRPHHRRKNWYLDISIADAIEAEQPLDLKDIRFQTFLSGGKGGQNVNKVETGVRAVHIPSGLASESTDERSQHRNKETAIKRLSGKLYKLSEERNSSLKAGNRLEHSKIVRGNPVRVYEGLNFVRVL